MFFWPGWLVETFQEAKWQHGRPSTAIRIRIRIIFIVVAHGTKFKCNPDGAININIINK